MISEWHLDMSLVQDKLDTLALALANKVEREWPSRLRHLPFAQGFFGLTVRLSRISYRTVCYLCADLRLKETEWRWYYTLCVPTLNRAILDAIFNVMFMLEDIEKRSEWYQKSGWREAYRDYLRYFDAYADDPQWADFITGYRSQLQEGVTQFHITKDDLRHKNWWPNPGKMILHGVDPNSLPPTRQFLQYLNDWFYRDTSAVNHQSFFGLLRIGGLLLTDTPGLTDSQKARIESQFYPRHRAVQVARSVILLLCLVSEIENYFLFGLAPTAIEIWKLISEVPEAKELYEKRYAEKWPIINTDVGTAAPKGRESGTKEW